MVCSSEVATGRLRGTWNSIICCLLFNHLFCIIVIAYSFVVDSKTIFIKEKRKDSKVPQNITAVISKQWGVFVF